MSSEKIRNFRDNNSIGRTFFVVFILCLVCSAAVSSVVVGLKARQQAQKLLDKQRNILEVAGLLKSKMSSKEIQSLYNTYVSAKILDFETIKISNSNGDFTTQLCDKNTLTVLSPEQDLARIHYRANKVEIFLIKNDHGKVEEFILPIYGSGLWSLMQAFIAVDADGIKSRGIIYYSHGETPGLGGEVDNPQWRSQWIGKKLYDQQGRFAIKIMRDSRTIDNSSNIDGLSGATLTSNSIQKMVDFWFGSNGFGPFLDKVRKGKLDYD